MNKLLKGISAVYYYLIGNILVWLVYDKKYITGRWFKTRWHNFGAPGWTWVVKSYFNCRRLGANQNVKWPVSPLCNIKGNGIIEFCPDDLNNFQSPGCYFQCVGNIIIGKGTYIAPNVGIITANHLFENLDVHAEAKEVNIGEKCWIGMNAMVLPGITLGDHTIVGAGSVVTKSFPKGHCIIAGNPAEIIKIL